MWTNKDVSYRHLKVFDYLAYVYIAKDKQGKQDPKTRLCIFLGYEDEEFGYRLWDIVDKNVVRSQDIVFMEEMTIVDEELEKNTSARTIGS